MKNSLILAGCLILPMTLSAQQLRENYIDWGNGEQHFRDALSAWEKGQPLFDSEDENFFISRVKPKLRFRNAATQVNQSITADNDKQLLFWVPINNTPNNALPDGVFDSEVFPMWSYITHYGNWTAPFVRMPGNFADVAHKNGVGVSVLAGIPWADFTAEWQATLNAMIDNGADKMADLLEYYGIDGLGYNSEFRTNSDWMNRIISYHTELYAQTKGSGRMPLYMMSWYDGTNDNGQITFDQGLGSHNERIFGNGEGPVSSFFFNYNWNRATLLNNSVTKAGEIGRNSLDLYAGVNMQGGQPGYNSWTLLKDYPISVGLWGAHSQNMFFESRGEKGANPDVKQRTYLQRVERYFTGGTRNPLNTPEVSNMMSYHADNYKFFGMSKFMSAKSSLSWDLSDEPFITYFNLGNGRYFNWEGKTQHNSEWYNIGIQDYLPTWKWWFADKFMGRNASDVPQGGMDAEFTWDDAWMGGSLLKIHGTSANEYLHLFKTQFELASNDEITVRYKVLNGAADITLCLSAEGNENDPIMEDRLQILETSSTEKGEWVEKKFTLRGGLAALSGKTLAMVALHIQNAENLNLHLGEFSIVRGSKATPATPVVTSSAALISTHKGVDGKIIFNMPNNKQAGEPCYNLDVNTSMFKLYAQQENQEPVLMGATTSWAGMYYAVPFEYSGSQKIRFGVSAVALDMKSESDVAWGEYQQIGEYEINDNIEISKSVIKPSEDFSIGFVDELHEPAKWEVLAANGNVIASADAAMGVDLAEGIAEMGTYNLRLTGKVARQSGERVDSVRVFNSYIQITSLATGALPQITSLTANGSDSEVETKVGTAIEMAYEGRQADGLGSRGLDLKEQAFGFKASDMEMQPHKSFSVSFWAKVNQFNDLTQFVNIRDKREGWPKTDWGWVWNSVNVDGSFHLTFRGTDASGNKELSYTFGNTKIEAGPWTHFAYVFEYNDAQQLRFKLYVNGVEQEVTLWQRLSGGSAVESGTTNDKFHGSVYGMRGANIVAVGGPAFGRAGLDGVIDNFQYWDKAMTQEDVNLAIENITETPESLFGNWDFEIDPNSESGAFISTGQKPINAGIHAYTEADGEGQGDLVWTSNSAFTPGCPFIEGTAFVVETKPTWSTSASVAEATGNDKTGAAKLTFDKPGLQNITLTLANSWGKDTKSFPYVNVEDVEDGIEESEVENILNAYPNPFHDVVNLRFAAAGEYNVSIFDLTGRQVYRENQTINAGEFMQIRLNVEPGHYVVKVNNKEGKLLNVVKLIKN